MPFMKMLTSLRINLQYGHYQELLNECNMKKSILFVLLISSITAGSQSLKDLLYSGRLKTDSGTVIRKGDDLTSKIDTSKKKPVEPEKKKMTASIKDSSMTGLMSPADSAAVAAEGPKDNAMVTKDNNKIWKEYIDSLTGTLKTEALPSKKIKNGNYYLLVEYEIGPDGQISIMNVSCSPENSFLQQTVKERLTLTAPQMNPVLSNGKPRKVLKKYMLTLSKL